MERKRSNYAILFLVMVTISLPMQIYKTVFPSTPYAFADNSIVRSSQSQVTVTPILSPTVTTTLLSTATRTVTPTVTASLTPTPTVNVDQVTQQELLTVYKDLVDANKQAVDTASKTLSLVMVLATLVSTILAATGIWSVFNAKEAVEKVKNVSSEIEELVLVKAQIQADLEKLNSELRQSSSQLQQLVQAERDLQSQIKGDTAILERLQALAEVDRYAMEFFGDDETGRKAAKQGLIQLAKNPDAIIRRGCLRVFAAMPDYLDNWLDREVYAQIEFMISNDRERGVRKEAEATKTEWRRRAGRQWGKFI